jgi:subtilase family serine protease
MVWNIVDQLAAEARVDRRNSKRSAPRERGPSWSKLGFETLERRQLLAAAVTTAASSEIAYTQYIKLNTLNKQGALDSFGLSGDYSPIEIRHAYGFDKITFGSGKVAADGTGETIAIVDAFNDPNIVSDLHQFDTHFGLVDPSLTVVNQTGGTTLPVGDAGWAGEISLDVEWSHAIAPGAKILLVEATDDTLDNLMAAVDYASSVPNVVVVSNSYGSDEFSTEATYDSNFTTTGGITYVVSAGDNGAPANYPSASPDVLSVGGTSLTMTSSATIASESAWTGGGGGISAYELQPSYQNGVKTGSTVNRATPDVSYDADPNTGFPVFDTYESSSPWGEFGGTSDAAPQWAALVAIADEGRRLAGEAPLSGQQLMTDLYALPATDFHDITTGKSLGDPTESAAKGYDLATGLGSPVANLIVAALVGGTTTTPAPATHLSLSAPSTTVSGSPFSLTVTAESATNTTTTSYTGTIHFTSSDLAAGLPSNYTFTAADNGVHTFTGLTLTATGTQSLIATDTTTSTITGSTSVTVTAAVVTSGTTHLTISAPNTSVAGSPFSITVTALNSSNAPATTYIGTVHFTTTDTAAGVVLPADYTFKASDNGVHTFTGLALDTAGPQLITATDKSTSSINGSSTTTVTASVANHIAFGQQPTSATTGAVITPAVTVKILDVYNNLLTADNTGTVTISLGSNPGGGTLSGTLTAAVSGGVATFSNLSINQPGNGYTLSAKTGSLAAVSSSSFNETSTAVSTSSTVEGFESGNLSAYQVAAGSTPTASVSTAAKHDGTYGLLDTTGNDWIYRTDAAAQVTRGDTISVWVQFSGSATGRAYFGFGTSAAGSLSHVAAPNTNQLILQNNTGYGYTDLADVTQTYAANHWYRLEVDWGTSGTIIGKLFDSNGTTLLKTVTASTTAITSGGFGFRAFGSPVYWDTVTVTTNANNFAVPAGTSSTVSAAATSAAVASSPALASSVSVGLGVSTITSAAAKTVSSGVSSALTPAQLAATDAVHGSGSLQECSIEDLLTTVTSGLLQRKS